MQASKHGKPIAWEDGDNNEIKSFSSVVNAMKPTSKLNFRPLFNEDKVEESYFVLPMAVVAAIKHKFDNTLVMRDDEGVHFFKFDSSDGVEHVLQQGPWMIRNTFIILNKWTPNLSLAKDEVTKVPVWVKLHRVPLVAYSEDGLSLIASQVGTPIMLDAFTSAMCEEP
ncbi:hypothetical protein Tco_0208784 [Tanacetum coccineum]